MSLLAQLSDPHIGAAGQNLFGDVDTAAMLRAAIHKLLSLPRAVDAVLVTGDLVDSGSAPEYAHLLSLLAPLRCPVYLVPGNHDDREQLRRSLERHPSLATASASDLPGYIQYVRQIGALRLITLDTNAPGQPHGELCEVRLAWLERALAADPAAPTVVALHHPPFASGIACMDSIALNRGASELEAILRRHPQVERLVCGHLHRSMCRRLGGTIVMSAPSTAHQIHLDLKPLGEPAYTREAPGFLLHHLGDEGLVSHLVNVGEHDQPHHF